MLKSTRHWLYQVFLKFSVKVYCLYNSVLEGYRDHSFRVDDLKTDAPVGAHLLCPPMPPNRHATNASVHLS